VTAFLSIGTRVAIEAQQVLFSEGLILYQDYITKLVLNVHQLRDIILIRLGKQERVQFVTLSETKGLLRPEFRTGTACG